MPLYSIITKNNHIQNKQTYMHKQMESTTNESNKMQQEYI